MEKDKPPQLVTPTSVTAIISKIEAAQLTRAQEVISEMRKLSFYWGLMWRLGADPRFGKDSTCGPLGILGFSTSWVCRQITTKYPPLTLGLCKAGWSQSCPSCQPLPKSGLGPGREQPMETPGWPRDTQGWVLAGQDVGPRAHDLGSVLGNLSESLKRSPQNSGKWPKAGITRLKNL